MGKSRINNPEKLTIVGTQDTGRRQTQSIQNKKHTTQKTKMMSNIDPYCVIFSFVTYLRHCKKGFALGITLDLRNYNAPAGTYLFPIIYYTSTMINCSATPNGCVGELLVNKGLSRIGLYIWFCQWVITCNLQPKYNRVFLICFVSFDMTYC